MVEICNHKIIVENINLSDRHNMLYAGTNVLTGRAKAVVCSVGTNTEIGKIAHEVNNRKETKSNLSSKTSRYCK